MIADKIFYSDAEHHVIVTNSTFIVKNKEYEIPKIRNHDIKEVRQVPVPGILLAVFGVAFMLIGLLKVMTFSFIPEITLYTWTFNGYDWVVVTGAVLSIIATWSILHAMLHPHYALHISTTNEENDVIVTPKREHLKQIIDALNRAFMLRK